MGGSSDHFTGVKRDERKEFEFQIIHLITWSVYEAALSGHTVNVECVI